MGCNADPTEFSAGSYRELRSRHGPSELSRPKGTDNNQSLDWLQLCNDQSLRADWPRRENNIGTAVLGKPLRRTQLRAANLESFQPREKEWARRGRWGLRQVPSMPLVYSATGREIY